MKKALDTKFTWGEGEGNRRPYNTVVQCSDSGVKKSWDQISVLPLSLGLGKVTSPS